jgi:hypothetical protein
VSDIVLQEDQKLLEYWVVEYTGKDRRRRRIDEWVECRIIKMYHSTIYAGSTGYGKTVDEARLNAVLGLACAICDDSTAFQHDADDIFRKQQLGWFNAKMSELRDELDLLDDDDPPKAVKQVKRRIKCLDQLTAEWQEEHDYWPEERTK